MSRRVFLLSTSAGALAATLAPGLVRAAARPIHIGAVLPLTGGLQLFGLQAKAGIDIAVAEVNAAGGVLGRRLKITYADNRTDPRTALERSLQLIKLRKVLAVIGPIASSARDAMIPTHQRYKTPLLYATNYEGGACSRYVFSFNTVPHQELSELVPSLAESAGPKFYLFGADYVWPHASFRQARKIIKAVGGEVVGEEFVPFGTDAFAATIRRIRESGANVLLKALPGADGISFIKQAEAFGLMQQLTIGYLGLSEPYLAELAPDQGQDMWVCVPFAASLDSPGANNFRARVGREAREAMPASHYLLSHYNAVKAIAAALTKAGKVGRGSLISGLEGLEFDTPTGPMQIDPRSHHATMNMYLARSEAGKLQIVRPVGPIAPESACQ